MEHESVLLRQIGFNRVQMFRIWLPKCGNAPVQRRGLVQPRAATIWFVSSLTLRVLMLSLAAQFCHAGDNLQQGMELFEAQIRPTLIRECLRCHGEQEQQGNLRLDSADGWAAGGDSGAAIVAGDTNSLLLQVIRYEHSDFEMPPKGKLPEETIDAFTRWVELGAIDPRTKPAAATPGEQKMSPSVEQGKSFWSFRAVTDPPLPSVTDSCWPTDPIDSFVLARIEQSGMRASPDADPQTLLRRVCYDLVGLPPTNQQLESFIADPSLQAYQSLVDQLLQSEQFGQRWGRHWLDVVRYAQSSGGGRTLMFPEAWRYRDYVIESFNDDLPYDQFVAQQIAGDLLAADDWEQRSKNLIATAFLLLGPTNYELQDKEVLEMDVVDEQLDTLGKAMLGMTIGCARCHDHKFDPIPANDYYAMAGIFKSSRSLIHANVSQWNSVALPLSPEDQARSKAIAEELAAAEAELKRVRQQWCDLGGLPEPPQGQKSIDPQSIGAEIVIDDPQAERIGKWTESKSVAFFVGQHYLFGAGDGDPNRCVIYRPTLTQPGRYEVRVSYTPSSNRTTKAEFQIDHAAGIETVTINQRELPPLGGKFISLGQFEFDPQQNPRVVVSCQQASDGVVIADAVIFLAVSGDETETAEDVQRREALQRQLDRLQKRVQKIKQSMPKPPLAMAITDQPQPGDIHLAIRGSTHRQGDLIPRGVMQVASWESFPLIAEKQSGRKELANWIVDPRNPLTARVMVNRVWHWLIGQGIVTSVDNFGSMGDAPSHPELLDHLATSFVRDGWSVKRLIRRIVTSHTYRQASEPNESSASIDPGNRLLWRMNRKRLQAEDIRDSLLLVSGSLDMTHGGPNIKPQTKSEYDYQFDSPRRSVYLPVFRNRLPEIFEVFDFADPNIQRGKRSSSTISSQALLLMNHPFVIEQAALAAERLREKPAFQREDRITEAYRQVLGRPPSETELQIALDLLGDSDNNGGRELAMLYQVLFQCIDFRYVN